MRLFVSPTRMPAVILSICLALGLIYILDLSTVSSLSQLRNGELLNSLGLNSTSRSQPTSSQLPKCPTNPKPNLILASIDGPKWQDQMNIFLQTLEMSLGRAHLDNSRNGLCPPAPVHIKIICPEMVALDPPKSFRALMRRYPTLSFVGIMPTIEEAVVLKRFLAFADYMDSVASEYDKALVADLDIIFQRDPFAMPIRPGNSMVYYSEWRGFKIGQCGTHKWWFDGCSSEEAGPVLTHEQYLTYRPLDRICAGSVYGTSAAIRVYMKTMAEQLQKAKFHCNDQAMHIHIFYSGILDAALHAEGLGPVWNVRDDEALLGTVGTSPMVLFNEWGEILSERGDVQHIVHQYKHHWLLADLVYQRYSWFADPGDEVMPEVGHMVPQSEAPELIPLDEGQELQPDDDLMRYVLTNVSSTTCGEFSKLCSCREKDCQFRY